MAMNENPGGARYGKTLVGGHLIGGKLVGEKSKDRFKSLNPSHLEDVIGDFPVAGPREVNQACAAAREAFYQWRSTPAPVRGEVIHKLGQLLREQKETLSHILSREMGKPVFESRGEVQEAIDTATFFASEGRRLYGQTVPSELRMKELETFRRPIGVCAMITACNFPVAVPSWKLIPAILCGNAAIWKPSEMTPVIGFAFARLFEAAGLPPGVLNVLHGPGDPTGEAILNGIDKGLIDKISFTGSTKVGRKVGEIAGRNLQVPSLELGGKNPMIVMEDANLNAAVEGAFFSGYGTGGQRCTSLGNLILHKKIADKFVKKFLSFVKDNLVIGDPSLSEDISYGPMINEKFMTNYLNHHKMAKKSKSAKALLKGERITSRNKPKNFIGDPKKGYFVTPTLYDNVKITDELAQTEIFGPTFSIIRVKDFDEAMEAANGTPYGLSSAIYTDNPVYRTRFKSEITAGMSSINNTTSGAEAHLPFGGNGWSGNGTRESGIWVIDAYTKWQCVNIDDSGGLQLAQMDVEEVAGGAGEDFMAEMLPDMGN